MISGGKKKKKSKSKPKSCPPFPPLDEQEVRQTAKQAIEDGLKGVGRVTSYVGQALFPVDQNKKPIQWPKSPPWELPPKTPSPVVCQFAAIKAIVSTMDVPDEPEPAPKPGEVLTDLLADTPTPGKFWLVLKDGPNALGASGAVAQALNKIDPAANTGANRTKYLQLMSGKGGWNYEKYGRTKFTDNWPPYTGADGRNIGTAWLPRHKNAIQAIASGKDPQRNISLTGSKTGSGSSYGLVWFPPLDEDSLKNLGAITTGTLEWSDGSSVLNPPPELLGLLE